MIGRTFAHYEITGHLGSGGMGEVYQASDSKLGRSVAIKLLPEAFALDSNRVSRFEREARVLASLNHPNIATIYGFEKSDDQNCLVMELVPGETLAERIKQGPVPLDEALGIAKEIAAALEAAHEKNVVHRDLKPANVKITPDGKVKVLDFGLAKAYEPAVSNSNLSNSPTAATIGGTHAGTIMGTAAYMSPEQAKGREVDKRSDIFAFGCVLFEMITGRRAFDGEDVTDILGAVLRMEPDWNQLPASIPPAVRRLLRLCLEKNVKNRRSDATDVRLDIEQAMLERERPALVSAPVPGSRLAWMVAVGFVGVSIILGMLLILAKRSAREPAIVSFSVQAPDKTVFQAGSGADNFGVAATAGVISPDGQTLAFTAVDGSGHELLWVRPLGSLTAQPLQGTDGAVLPFWSPNSRAIGFFADRKLKRVDVGGGPPQVLSDAPDLGGGAWNADGVILFAPNGGAGLYRVSSAGGEATLVVKPPVSTRGFFYPSFLPDGRHFIFYSQESGDNSGVRTGALDSTETKPLMKVDTAARFGPPGELLFVRQGTLFAQAFDAGKLELSGEPVRIAESVPFDFSYPAFSVSENGVLSYRTGAASQTKLQLGWFDRTGKLLETVGNPGGYAGPGLSPDGKRMAVHRHEGEGGDIWIFESSNGPMPRFTFDEKQENSNPVWSPDGREIAFASLRNGKWGIYRKPSNLTGTEELLVESELPKYPTSWSPDGNFIVFGVIDPQTVQDIWLLPLTGDRKAIPILNSRFIERDGQISPNGKWLAYASDETGQREVYIRPFPTGEGKHQISTTGGTYPRWRGDGKELFYYLSLLNTRLVSVNLNIFGSTFESSTPQELFDSKTVTQVPGHGLNWIPYTIAPDGQRFLIPRSAGNMSGDSGASPLTVILNWTELLKRK